MDEAVKGAQRGLLMRAIFGQILTVHLKDHTKETEAELQSIVKDLDAVVEKRKPQCGLIVAFYPKLWSKWTGREIRISTKVLDGNPTKFRNTHGDVFFYLKTPDHETAKELLKDTKARLGLLAKENGIETIIAGKRQDCRIVGGRYLDSITNPNDPVSLSEDIFLGGKELGSCFGFTQKFIFDWPSILSYSSDSQNEIVGRKKNGSILSQHAAHGHIHRANVRDANGDQRKLLRQALPFGTAEKSSGREEGLMFVAFCNEQQRFEDILKNLLGETKHIPSDRLMQLVSGVSGGYWYVPSASDLGVASVHGASDIYEDPHWKVRNPKNRYLFYNTQDYLHQMGQQLYKGGDPPTLRVLSLMARSFNHWHDGWVHRVHMDRLPHLSKLLEDVSKRRIMEDASERTSLEDTSVPVRKSVANFITLSNLLSDPDSKIAKDNGLLRIYGNELIVGQIPDFTFGRGKEVVPYLDKDETIKAWLKCSLNEFSAMGHVVPDYQHLVRHGLRSMINDLKERKHRSPKSADFFDSAITSLRGVQDYLRNWSRIALAARDQAGCPNKANMEKVAQRLRKLVDQAPETFHDAVQLIFSFHCCLHLVGELTPFGRLDQILWPFLNKDKAEPTASELAAAQEIIDCLYLKIGENAFVDRAFIYDHVTYGTTSVNGTGGNFPQGGGINQWCQQITVGGYKAENGAPQDASNPVTMLFLKAARRIPVNAPTLSLRVHKDSRRDILEEAAKTILSGGAQPILYNDDKLCEGLHKSGATIDTVSEAWSRNYAADGCYEPMFAGASEFTFNNVSPLRAVEQTINRGTAYGAAGPEQLSGLKQTFRSPEASTLSTFKELKDVFLEQLEWLTVQCYNLMLNNYGNLANICPSPLLSTLIDGCIEKGLDHTNGGARFHIIAPLFVGVSNTIDSLYSIWKLVYDSRTASTTLEELLLCLINDWGYNMIEPYQNQLLGPVEAAERGEHYRELRDQVLQLPKWGSGSDDIDLKDIGDWVMKHIVRLGRDVLCDPHPALAAQLDVIKQKHGPDFEFTVTPGIGTFEGYVGDGVDCGASADGRRNGTPIASDLSPAPGAQDLPPNPAFRNIYQAMKSWKSEDIEIGLSDAAPVDMNIPEDFPLEELEAFIQAFAAGTVGGNLITLTCADPGTYAAASEDPEKYNLLRVRMGGWTEFYSTLFPEHQKQHQRRQYFTHKVDTEDVTV
ncbi:hypothetical protein JX265_000375 [Neoarthrinium moseri]|uniref:Uncharacterized protein n=1 Tax=Neoarthrinium moseri TaxID=1658444 RepID=A0A9P9WYM7_9PEZI|nr:hypothetical protein JX265_000375 [Neoarthrinium moseri]